MTLQLSSELDFLLHEVARKCRIDVSAIRTPTGVWQISSSDRQVLMNALSAEFVRSGLKEDDEPNSRGLAIESVLDRLNAIH